MMNKTAETYYKLNRDQGKIKKYRTQIAILEKVIEENEH